MTISGVITKIFDVQTKNGFTKREFILNTDIDTDYPQFIKFEMTKGYEVLDMNLSGIVSVHFNVRGRKWVNPKGEEIYFNTLRCWSIETEAEQQINEERDNALINGKAMTDRGERMPPPDDDLPF